MKNNKNLNQNKANFNNKTSKEISDKKSEELVNSIMEKILKIK